MSALDEALARQHAAECEIERLRQVIRDAEAAMPDADLEYRVATIAVDKALAAEDSYVYPVGSRVRHRAFSDVLGTVQESDGTGLSILQDGQDVPTTGFTAREWVLL